MEKGFSNISKISLEPDLDTDYKKTRRLINSKEIDLVIVDRYKIKNSYIRNLKKNIKTIVISDLKKIDYDADLVINGFIGFKNMKTINRYGATCLIGPKYQILNKKYEREIKHVRKKYFFLVTLGGFDEKKIIDIVCNQLIKYIDEIKVKIILGPATRKTNFIKNLESNNYKNFEVVSKVDSLEKEISKTKFGICAGGITSYEFASLGVPTIILCQYKHQLLTAKEWEKNNVGLNLGMPDITFEDNFQKIVRKILDGKIVIKSNQALVDGKGLSRVSKEILKN
jgi:spore coat polysaccharide biosynthesis predicted glycosyltransferase SpsG